MSPHPYHIFLSKQKPYSSASLVHKILYKELDSIGVFIFTEYLQTCLSGKRALFKRVIFVMLPKIT